MIPPTQTSGSYVGWLAIATIRPVLASMTTAAPESATYGRRVTGSVVCRAIIIILCSWCSTTLCTRASIDVTRVSPGALEAVESSPSTRPIESTATRW